MFRFVGEEFLLLACLKCQIYYDLALPRIPIELAVLVVLRFFGLVEY